MEKQSSSNKAIAFSAIVFCTVSITGCLLVFPLVFHYIQTLEANVQLDLDFCKSRSRDMWNTVFDISGHIVEIVEAKTLVLTKESQQRIKRASPQTKALIQREFYYRLAKDDPVPQAGGPSPPSTAPTSSCCTCHRGLAGPPGAPGRDGVDGANGAQGVPGERGDPAPSDKSILDIFPHQCPCEAAAGDEGKVGGKGPDGAEGDAGPNGNNGKDGEQGPRGPPGDDAKPGQNGGKGLNGDPGKLIPKPGPPGLAGEAGKPGAPGAPGQPGEAGKEGPSGLPGIPGDVGGPGANGNAGPAGPEGNQGPAGDAGGCTACPPARLAPGY